MNFKIIFWKKYEGFLQYSCKVHIRVCSHAAMHAYKHDSNIFNTSSELLSFTQSLFCFTGLHSQ
jgi:hypothetical protein